MSLLLHTSQEYERVILLTGAAGFIGSNVTLYLVRKYPNYHIIGYDALTYAGFKENLKEIWNESNFTFIKGNILSSDLVNHVLQEHKVDTIIHFAAFSHVCNSFGNSIEFTKNNILGTHTLLECAKQFKKQLRLFISVGTDECYGGESDKPCTEEGTVLRPTNPYASTKCGAEHLSRAYYLSFDLPIIITRGNNVVGPRQHPEKLVPKFITLMQRGEPCPIHGTGESRRSFLYVEDAAEAFDTIMHKGVIGQTYNIGCEWEYTVNETFERLANLLGLSDEDKLKSRKNVRDRHFNDFRYMIDCSKMKQLGWEAKTNFDTALRKTIDWYQSNPNHFGNIDKSLVAHPGQLPISNSE